MLYGVCLTVPFSDHPVLLAEVLQPRDRERMGSSGIWDTHLPLLLNLHLQGNEQSETFVGERFQVFTIPLRYLDSHSLDPTHPILQSIPLSLIPQAQRL